MNLDTRSIEQPMALPDAKRLGRTAGFLYLVVVLTGMFSLAYVPSHVAMDGDAARTVEALRASESLFRLGILSSVACYTAFLLLPLALYQLLSPAGKDAAALMVAFAVISVPISFANLGHQLDALSLMSGTPGLQAFTPDQINAQVVQSLHAYNRGLIFSKVFWGLWLLPFGYLAFKSRSLPRLLGGLLMLGCAGYLTDVIGHLLSPAYGGTTMAGLVRLPAALGEIGTCCWLLFFGAKPPR